MAAPSAREALAIAAAWVTVVAPATAEALAIVVGSVIGSYYRWVDSLVGELVAAAGPEYNVVVLSDHGMETASRWERKRTGHAGAHEEAPPGVIFARGPAIAKGPCALETFFKLMSPRTSTWVMSSPGPA